MPGWTGIDDHTPGGTVLFKKIALLLTMIFALAVSGAGAQEATPPLNPADVEGLESGYARMYIADIEANGDAPAGTPRVEAN